MSGAEYGERGGIAAMRATTALHVENPMSDTSPFPTFSPSLANTESMIESPLGQDIDALSSNTAQTSSRINKSDDSTGDNLDLIDSPVITRTGLLRDAVFPDWKDDTGGDSTESAEEMQRKDPLGTQIWKLYSRTKTRLPNQERMENLTWRMMAMNLRRREQMQAAYVILVTCCISRCVCV